MKTYTRKSIIVSEDTHGRLMSIKIRARVKDLNTVIMKLIRGAK